MEESNNEKRSNTINHPENYGEDDIASNLKELRSYAEFKLALADSLRSVRNAFSLLGRKEAEDQCKQLTIKLAEDRFTLAVLGQFKRGKSSLMNAIIGKEILPTGVLPLTSAITVLKYGPTEQLIIDREGGLYPAKLPVTALPEYVTEKGNPNNERKVKTATLEMPEPFLRYGIEFTDTPGVGSAITANTETTYQFLPECDAVLFVTGVDTPMTDVELEFLKKIRQYVDRIFFIINKIDLANADEQKEIIEFVTNAIRAAINRDNVKVFPISSRLALEARTSNNTSLFEHSGLKALEDALAVFLTQEKTTVFLSAVAQKILRLIEEEISKGILTEEFLHKRSEEIKSDRSISLKRDPHVAASLIQTGRQKLNVLIGDVPDNNQSKAGVASVAPENLSDDERLEKQDEEKTLEVSVESNKVMGDLQVMNCPVCQYMADQIFDYFVHWQYKLSTDEATQKEFAMQHGFCSLHTWQLLSISSPYGASVGYARFASLLAQRLKAIKNFETAEIEIKNLLPDVHNCKACAFLKEIETNYLQQLSATLETKEAQGKYSYSQGICLRHLSMLIQEISSAEVQKLLLTHTIECFEQDAEDMRSFALKNDALRRALQNINEQNAYKKTILRFAGDKRISVSWAEDADI